MHLIEVALGVGTGRLLANPTQKPDFLKLPLSGTLLLGVQGLLQAQQLARAHAQAFTYRSPEFTKFCHLALL